MRVKSEFGSSAINWVIALFPPIVCGVILLWLEHKSGLFSGRSVEHPTDKGSIVALNQTLEPLPTVAYQKSLVVEQPPVVAASETAEPQPAVFDVAPAPAAVVPLKEQLPTRSEVEDQTVQLPRNTNWSGNLKVSGDGRDYPTSISVRHLDGESQGDCTETPRTGLPNHARLPTIAQSPCGESKVEGEITWTINRTRTVVQFAGTATAGAINLRLDKVLAGSADVPAFWNGRINDDASVIDGFWENPKRGQGGTFFVRRVAN